MSNRRPGIGVARAVAAGGLVLALGAGAISRPPPGGPPSRSSPVIHPPDRPASAPAKSRAAPPRPALPRDIRVCLVDGEATVVVDAGGGAALVDADTGAPLGKILPGLITVVFEEHATRFREIGVAVTAASIDMVPADGVVGLARTDGTQWFAGKLRLLRRTGQPARVINVLDVEEYLAGVVAAELDTRFSRETFRAQAIAARTFAWYQMRTAGRKRDFDVTATESTQTYQDLDRVLEVPAALAAVGDTSGVVCTWASPPGDRIFCTYYGSACGGWTAPGTAVAPGARVPPLAGDVACPFCQETARFRWGPVWLGKDDLATRLRARLLDLSTLDAVAAVRVLETTSHGRPVRLGIRDGQGREEKLEVERFRLAVDPGGREVRSTFFTIEDAGEGLWLRDGRGFGHGAGLCQYGAEALARRGLKAADILEYYYPGARLRRAY